MEGYQKQFLGLSRTIFCVTPKDTVEFFPEEEEVEVSSSSSATAPVEEEASNSPIVTVPVQTRATAPVQIMTTPGPSGGFI